MTEVQFIKCVGCDVRKFANSFSIKKSTGLKLKKCDQCRAYAKLNKPAADKQCPQCPQKCTSTALLRMHIKTHDDIRDFSCPQCSQTFSREGYMKDHIKIAHIQTRDHQCPTCPYTATLASYMKEHIGKCTGGLRMSTGEFAVKGVLEAINIPFHREKRFADCRNKITLPYDFYLPNHMAIIEYDGEHHFGPIAFFGGQEKFEQQQANDAIKKCILY